MCVSECVCEHACELACVCVLWKDGNKPYLSIERLPVFLGQISITANCKPSCVGLARTIYIQCIYTVFLAGKLQNIRSYTVCIYGSGQPYSCATSNDE